MIPGSANPLLLKSAAAAGGYQIERSLRFSSNDSAFCSRVVGTPTSNKIFTFSTWVKRSTLSYTGEKVILAAGASASGGDGILFFQSTNIIGFSIGTIGIGDGLVSTAVFRDASAWYHIVAAVDTTQATTSNRVKLYVNGSQITTFTVSNYPTLDAQSKVNTSGETQVIGKWGYTPYGGYFDGLLAECIFVDGQALDPTYFAETNATTGAWNPKSYSGSYGAQGWRLNWSDNSSNTAATLGKDTSGNSNNWTPNNLSVTAGAGNDSLVDTPTSYGTDSAGVGGVVRGNYATLNPLDAHSSLTITNGNLDLSNTASTTRNVRGTIGFPSSGKWYYEVTPGGYVSGAVGIGSSAVPLDAQNAASSVIYFEDGTKGVDASRTAYGASYASGNVIGVAFNADTNQVTFYKNGVSQGALSTTAGVQYFPFIVTFNATYSANFGQRAFAYTAPSGFKALCDTNLPSPVVAKPNTVFDTKIYTGNGGTQTISGLAFSPDFVWVKNRSNALSHRWTDVLRGVEQEIGSDYTGAEYYQPGGLSSFNADGFTVGSNNGSNASGNTYVAWTWDAGSSTVTNTAGSITSQVRANPSAGFSVVTYTGTGATATVGHGLGVTPSLILCKSRTATVQWVVYHADLGKDKFLGLNTTDAAITSASYWGAGVTSTVFGLQNLAGGNNNGNMVAYCFAPVAGYSNGFSYTGNGSADGPYIHLGFRTRFLILKRTDASGDDWLMVDTARNPYNLSRTYLYANSSSAEMVYDLFDITANGIKLRDNYQAWNASGGTYVGFAWAEAPFAYSRAR